MVFKFGNFVSNFSHPSAEKDLDKLENEVARRIINKVESCSEFPFHYLEMLKGYPYYKLRIGDYRAIIDLDKGEEKLTVVLVGHRDDIYKKLDRK